jgi:hypothetical protein
MTDSQVQLRSATVSDITLLVAMVDIGLVTAALLVSIRALARIIRASARGRRR